MCVAGPSGPDVSRQASGTLVRPEMDLHVTIPPPSRTAPQSTGNHRCKRNQELVFFPWGELHIRYSSSSAVPHARQFYVECTAKYGDYLARCSTHRLAVSGQDPDDGKPIEASCADGSTRRRSKLSCMLNNFVAVGGDDDERCDTMRRVRDGRTIQILTNTARQLII